MLVKTDTKEKFTVITPEDGVLTANMAEELRQLLHPYMQKDNKHIVLNLKMVMDAELPLLAAIVDIQQEFYENSASFVICELQQQLEDKLEKLELLEVMNVTPTESEAWDIVQMEEIERELLDE